MDSNKWPIFVLLVAMGQVIVCGQILIVLVGLSIA